MDTISTMVIANTMSKMGIANRIIESNEVPIIAIMGVTGSGKSHMIATLTGDYSITGERLISCTQEVMRYGVTIQGKKVILIDSPGFSDTNHSDSVILKKIADFLNELRYGNRKLSGIVYMYDITQQRMCGSSLSSLELFRELCGEDFYKNVVFVTNKWHKVSKDEGNSRLNELKETDRFFGFMLRRGARIVNYGVDMLFDQIVMTIMENKAGDTKLIKELVAGKKLSETDAGKVASEEVRKLKESHKKEIEDIKKQLKEEKDKEVIELLKKAEEEAQEKMDRAIEEERELREHQMKDLTDLKDLKDFVDGVKYVGMCVGAAAVVAAAGTVGAAVGASLGAGIATAAGAASLVEGAAAAGAFLGGIGGAATVFE
jgi:GTP-binding protein EngB required for normal cell division